MDKLHSSMVRQMEEADMMTDQGEVGGVSQRKTSVSAACQTEKVDIYKIMESEFVIILLFSRCHGKCHASPSLFLMTTCPHVCRPRVTHVSRRL